MKKNLYLLLKIIVSAVIVAVLLRKIPFADIASAVASANVPVVIIGLLTGPTILLISALNTKVLLDAQGVRLKLTKIFEINYSAEFYNFLIPGFLTGGFIRWHQFSRSSGKPAASLATVTYVRLWDTIILLGAGIMLWFMDPVARQKAAIGFSLALAFVTLLIVAFLCFNEKITVFIDRCLNRMNCIPSHIKAKTGSVLLSFRVFDTHRRHVLSATITLTILRNICGITAYFLFSRSLGITISAVTLGWIRSVVHTVLLLPISFSGVGVREGGMVVFLKDYGVLPAEAVALSFLLLLNTLGVRCIGACITFIKFVRENNRYRDNKINGKIGLHHNGFLICSFGTRLASGNTGDKSVFLGIRDSLGRLHPARFIVLSRSPEIIERLYDVTAYSPKYDFVSIIRMLRKSDLVLITGGTPFYDDSLIMLYRLFLVCAAKIYRKPVVILGISLRQVPRGVSRFCIHIMIRLANIAGAREYATLRDFKRIAGDTPRVTTIPDPATQMVPCDHDEAKRLLSDAGVNMEAPVVGICLRNLIVSDHFRKQVYADSYNQEDIRNLLFVINETIRYLVLEKGCWVVLLPMNDQPPDDDRRTESELLNTLNDRAIRARITLIDKTLSPRQMKGIFGLFYATLSVRFHAVVFSSSMHIPVVSVGYDKKNTAFMEYLGFPEFATTIRDVTSAFLKKSFDRIFDEHETIVGRLKERYRQIHKDYAAKAEQIIALANQSS